MKQGRWCYVTSKVFWLENVKKAAEGSKWSGGQERARSEVAQCREEEKALRGLWEWRGCSMTVQAAWEAKNAGRPEKIKQKGTSGAIESGPPARPGLNDAVVLSLASCSTSRGGEMFASAI